MRTKTMLLTAALSAAGLITSFAQGTVYSVNVVGYINLTLTPGYSLIANQLDDLKGNLVPNLIPAPPNNTTVYKYNGVNYDITAFVDGVWDEAAATISLNPGEGCFINIDRNEAPTGATLTFVGEVRQSSTGLVTPIKRGYQMISSQVPQAGSLATDLGYTPSESDTVYLFDAVTKQYKIQAYIDAAWGGDFGDGVEPPIAVGEAFFLSVQNATPPAWSRIFEIK